MIREIAEAEDGSEYIMFWNNFGKYLKVGVVEDDKNRKEIAPLLRFFSSKSGEEYTSLDAYIEKMPETQKSIYYVTGEGRRNTAMSPVIEKLKSRGLEVLFATEPLDEIMLESLRSYKEKDIVDAAKEGLKVDDENEDSKKKKEDLNREYNEVIEYLEILLKGKVEKVTVSDLLTDSPAALVQGAYGMSPTMQRYMRVQAVASGDEVNGLDKMNKVVMEINPNHPIIKDLGRMVKADKEGKETESFALLMFDVAGMTSGYDVTDMSGFAKRVMGLMSDPVEEKLPDAEVVNEAVERIIDEGDDEDEDAPREVEVM
jgi:molecular chaperone HtpG